jgi:hypothetical protein
MDWLGGLPPDSSQNILYRQENEASASNRSKPTTTQLNAVKSIENRIGSLAQISGDRLQNVNRSAPKIGIPNCTDSTNSVVEMHSSPYIALNVIGRGFSVKSFDPDEASSLQ